MGTAFVDTSVFASALDAGAGAKQIRAQQLLDTRRGDITVSTQVLIELHAVCTRTLGLSQNDAATAVRSVGKLPTVETDRDLVLRAASLAESAELSIFDALIVCAAQRAGCGTLLTEDLRHGQEFDGLRVENPFREDA